MKNSFSVLGFSVIDIQNLIFILAVSFFLSSCQKAFDDYCPVEYFDLEVYNSTSTDVNFVYSLNKSCLATSSGIGDGLVSIKEGETFKARIGERDASGLSVAIVDDNRISLSSNLFALPDNKTISLIITFDGKWYYIDSKEDYDKLKPAIIHDTGSLELDGCGWLIETSNKFYSPDWFETALYEHYREDGLNVLLDYMIYADTLKCELGASSYSKIGILMIRK